MEMVCLCGGVYSVLLVLLLGFFSIFLVFRSVLYSCCTFLKAIFLVCYSKFCICSVLISFRSGGFSFICDIVASSSSEKNGVYNVSALFVDFFNYFRLHFFVTEVFSIF